MVTKRTRTITTTSRPGTLVLPPDSSSPDQTGAQATPLELLPSGHSEDGKPPSGRPLSVFSTATTKPGSKGGKGRGKGKGKKSKMRKEEEDIHRVVVEEVVDEDVGDCTLSDVLKAPQSSSAPTVLAASRPASTHTAHTTHPETMTFPSLSLPPAANTNALGVDMTSLVIPRLPPAASEAGQRKSGGGGGKHRRAEVRGFGVTHRGSRQRRLHAVSEFSLRKTANPIGG
ncbi:hypothetical protein QFC24_005755 [Naganishia onofrii]|uniref:Uncharacterized protein n=1 Tax=Naganishia onofrii TaxID=1851511 RepID=A0ACC2X796_9TREE|nr:hypothetical protein QFC24_005755 [Naganishia onofrii]